MTGSKEEGENTCTYIQTSQRKSQHQQEGTRESFVRLALTLEFKAVGFGAIAEPNRVIRVGNGPEHVHLLAGRVVGDYTRLQLGEVLSAAADSDLDRRVLGLEGSVQNLLDAAPPVLER